MRSEATMELRAIVVACGLAAASSSVFAQGPPFTGSRKFCSTDQPGLWVEATIQKDGVAFVQSNWGKPRSFNSKVSGKWTIAHSKHLYLDIKSATQVRYYGAQDYFDARPCKGR
jgi:hypothetical protein